MEESLTYAVMFLIGVYLIVELILGAVHNGSNSSNNSNQTKKQ